MSISSLVRITLALPLAALAACGELAPPIAPSAPAASAVPAAVLALDWQSRSRALVSAARQSPLAAARVYAALSVAQHRAVREVDAAGLADGGRALAEARRGAVAGASARVLGWLFPASAGTLNAMVDAQANAGPGNVHPHFRRGAVVGQRSGDQSIARLASEGFTSPWTGSIPVGPGMWTTAILPPAGATFGQVTPYYLSSGAQFRPAAHPPYGSAEFQAGADEVVTRSTTRTPQELAMALKWDMPAGTHTPIGYWNEVAATYVAAAGLDERAATEVLSVMHAAVFDALLGCWEAKYHYWLLRPSQAAPAVSLALPLPNHPAYPSGHSCASASAAGVLAHFFPEREAELATLVEEAGLSRIVAGIHYRFDVTAGQELGRRVAALAVSRGAF